MDNPALTFHSQSIRRFLCLVAAFGLGGSAVTMSFAADNDLPNLEAYRWTHRVLIVETVTLQDPAYREQAALWVAVWEEMLERDLVVRTRVGANAFRLRLIGKDGGAKVDRSTVITTEELFAIIDAMPMRRDEMRRKSAP